MTIKLSWDYDTSSGNHIAPVGENYRIVAKHDSSPSNPFEDEEGNWPIVVYSDRTFFTYEFGVRTMSTDSDNSVTHINDGLMVHAQHAIAKVVGFDTIEALMEAYLTEEPVKYCRDADVLRDGVEQALGDISGAAKLEAVRALYEIAGVPATVQQVIGYSQGDYVDVLVVATPEAQEKFGCTTPPTLEDLESTAKLYGYWALGDVYGYVVEKDVGVRPIFDEHGKCSNLALLPFNGGMCPDPDDEYEPEWEEVEDGSCWGFYGSDFAESGLEEAALGCIPTKEMADA